LRFSPLGSNAAYYWKPNSEKKLVNEFWTQMHAITKASATLKKNEHWNITEFLDYNDENEVTVTKRSFT